MPASTVTFPGASGPAPSVSTRLVIGQPLSALDTPQLVIDLDIVDANLKRLFEAARDKGVAVRTHFKSLKCARAGEIHPCRGGP